MLAKIERYGTGRCMLTGAETGGVEVRFRDGSLKGFVAWEQFQKLLKARGNGQGEAPRYEPSRADEVPAIP